MKNTTLSILMLSIILLASNCSQNKSQNPRPLTEEETRIESIVTRATFEGIDGNNVNLNDYKGKVVLIDFWETWCGPCLMVFPAMDSLRSIYPDDFEVLAVNLMDSDTKEDVQKFMQEKGYDFVFSLDTEGIGSKIITLGIPFKVFIDPQGYLIKAETGTRGTAGDFENAKIIIENNKKS
jgi:thiol-disulfide isomerase/thioredoxin